MESINNEQKIKVVKNTNTNTMIKEYPINKPTNKITYEDIMKNMGIYQYNNKLFFLNNTNTNSNNNTSETLVTPEDGLINKQQKYLHNSYIYNKYFKNHINNESSVEVPKNINEYRDNLIREIIQKYKIRKMKSTKIIIPTNNNNYIVNNIQVDENKLFDFSKR
jgi:hypothetical protein